MLALSLCLNLDLCTLQRPFLSTFALFRMLAAALHKPFFLPVPPLRLAHGVKSLVEHGRGNCADAHGLTVFGRVLNQLGG